MGRDESGVVQSAAGTRPSLFPLSDFTARLASVHSPTHALVVDLGLLRSHSLAVG